jgi:UDP-N-acetylmuramoylalanine--D-glutamate ligase
VTLDELCARRVAVWGLGSEGLATARLLRDRGSQVSFVDDHPAAAAERLRGEGIETEVVAPAELEWSAVEVVMRAPGVSRYRPELEEARSAGVVVTTAMAVWLEDFADARVVAITGTKGKSTTAALTAAILAQDGRKVALIGNIGVPVVETYGEPVADAYVVEISSYQAADVEVSPGLVVLTSLAPDHLDWHRSEEAYYRDKLRLVEAGPPGSLAVNAGSEEAMRRTVHHPDRTLFGPSGRVRVDDASVVHVDGVPVVDASGLRLAGVHNLWNLCGAITGAMLLDRTPPAAATMEAVVAEFGGLPSRCRTVGQRDGVTFVDDALASNPFATEASVSAFEGRDLTLILGGADRGVDPRQLVNALVRRRPVPAVVVLPPDAERMAGMLAAVGSEAGRDGHGTPPLRVAVVGDLENAVDAAVTMTPPGGVVLFSPAAPTPDGEGGYSVRSRRFVAAAGLDGGGPDRSG